MADGWFVCPRPSPGARSRLFFFPYAGGGPNLFYRWCAELPGGMEGWIAHFPGRGSRHREPAIHDMGRLVRALSEAIVPLLDRPFAFFGHSMGGIVIFELARLLHRSHLPQPEALFVSGCAAPHLLSSKPAIHALPDREFIEALRKLNGMPAELLNLPEAMELFLPSLRADFEIMERYQFVPGGLPLNCRILAFGGLDDPHITSDQLKGWAVHTDSGFRSEHFPGDHFFLNAARESILACIAAEIDNSSSNVN